MTAAPPDEARSQWADDELAVLREMPIFGGVPDRALRFLSDGAQRIEIPGGRWFFHQGDKGDTMYVLRSGLVEVRRALGARSETLGRLGPGECFGEMALIDLYPRSASVRAIEDCKALGIGHALLYGLYAEQPEPFTLIVMNLARELSRRLRHAEQLLFQDRGNEGPQRHRGSGTRETPYV